MKTESVLVLALIGLVGFVLYKRFEPSTQAQLPPAQPQMGYGAHQQEGPSDIWNGVFSATQAIANAAASIFGKTNQNKT